MILAVHVHSLVVLFSFPVGRCINGKRNCTVIGKCTWAIASLPSYKESEFCEHANRHGLVCLGKRLLQKTIIEAVCAINRRKRYYAYGFAPDSTYYLAL